MEHGQSISSIGSSGYASVQESLSDLSLEDFGSPKNQDEAGTWGADDVLLVTKATSSTIVIFCIYKVNERARCEYYRHARSSDEPPYFHRTRSQSLCDLLQHNRRTGLESGLKFYLDLLKNPSKSFTVYTDLLEPNFGKPIQELLERNLAAELRVQHHHQHDTNREDGPVRDYNRYYQAASKLLESDMITFKALLSEGLGSIEFHRPC